MSNQIWLSSEYHRRSVELANAIDCGFHCFLEQDNQIPLRFFRYLYFVPKLFYILLIERPDVVFVQNPSIVLTFLACLFKFFFKYTLVVDRHSNFKLDPNTGKCFKWKVFQWMSRFTIVQADITIVTNNFLKNLVDSMGGNGFILQDKIPLMALAQPVKLEGQVNIMVVSTFSDDEPIDAVFDTAKDLPADWLIHITGRYEGKDRFAELVKHRPDNVVLTGFIPEKEYQCLLLSADVVVVLTTEENLLTCGAYEAISVGKALVLSDTQTLRNYFRYGVLYCQNNSDSLRKNIINAVQGKEQLECDVLRLKDELEAAWQVQFSQLVKDVTCRK